MKIKPYLLPLILIIISVVCIVRINIIEKNIDHVFLQLNKVENDLSVKYKSEQKVNKESDSLIMAPKFILKNQKDSNVGLDDLTKEKKKLLVFTREDCSYCEDYYPELNKFAKKYSTSFDVVVIKLDSNVKDTQKTLDEKKYYFEILKGNEKVFMDYHIQSTPTTYLLNKNNEIEMGAIVNNENELEEWIFQI
ncbi:TlpA disulfide reductase family protein [uncultured Aquimarina sp.]|uniref:TlpA family protein disulfide reductase n=1 Tax=uncultured Aquimarina sp. TaxID=575652 RepID=UPI00262B1FF1|nr:TlpA disulfide reductase family protein [uncultured Aquimarina sp.]